MLIRCPHCGDRLSEEFTDLGDATKIRPTSNDPSTMDQWFDYVFIRDNPKGRHREYFQHTGGCRAWLVVERDTVTHEIYNVEDARTGNPRVRAEAAAPKAKRVRA
ncbi:MAG: sarcosine oxidase subunit delta [Hyphomicrobiales bacterium]